MSKRNVFLLGYAVCDECYKQGLGIFVHRKGDKEASIPTVTELFCIQCWWTEVTPLEQREAGDWMEKVIENLLNNNLKG